jgi:hypothetical protein
LARLLQAALLVLLLLAVMALVGQPLLLGVIWLGMAEAEALEALKLPLVVEAAVAVAVVHLLEHQQHRQQAV